MKVFLSTDIEGTAGIADWDQVIPGERAYDEGRRLLLAEVNAAIDGAVDAGATGLVVNDAHHTMHNLPADELHAEASLLSGKHKPLYMMEGLDGSFGAALFISYHGSVGGEHAVLSHTYNPSAVHEVRLNGTVVGESGINALVALHHRVPVALITGDEETAAEARAHMPEIETVVVKRSITRYAAESVHPDVACRMIREGARRAVERAASMAPPAIELPARLDVSLLSADMAEMATWVGGVERTGTRTIAITDAEPLAVYRRFVTVVALTRGIG